MAVAKSLSGVKITVWSNGKQLKEYKNKIRSIGGPVVKWFARFTEANTDTEFSFKIWVSSSFQLDCPNLLFSMYVDGVSVSGTLHGEYAHSRKLDEGSGRNQKTDWEIQLYYTSEI